MTLASAFLLKRNTFLYVLVQYSPCSPFSFFLEVARLLFKCADFNMSLENILCLPVQLGVLVVLICVTNKLYFIHFFNDFFPDRSRSSLFFTDIGLYVTKKSSLWAFVYVLLVSTLHCTLHIARSTIWVLVMWQALWRFKYDLSLFFGGCPRLLKPPLKRLFLKKSGFCSFL